MRALRRTSSIVVLQIGIVLGTIVGVAYAISRDIGIFGALGISLALVFAFQVQLHLREPEPVAVRPPPDTPVGRPFGRFQVLRERLRWGTASTSHFEAGVRPIIAGPPRTASSDITASVRAPSRSADAGAVDPVLAEFLAGPAGTEPPSGEELSIVVGKLEEL